MKITKYKDVPLDQIVIGSSQARTRDVNKNIDELARSIQTVGLLEPIVLAPLDGNEFEVITGQRRYLAVQRLGHSSISAGILDSRPDGDLSKAISLTENMVREDMTARDYIDACTTLYHRYGSIKAVSEELGLPPNRVSQYVKFEQLVPALKDRVRNHGLKMDVALRAQKVARAVDDDNDVDETIALTFADELQSLSNLQQKKLENVAEKNPDASVEEILEAGRRQAREVQLTITISTELRDALDRYADEEGTNRTDAASNIIENALVSDGYAKDTD